MNRETLQAALAGGVEQLQVPLDSRQLGLLLDYLDEIRTWNNTYNLTAVDAPEEMLSRHLLDSLAVLPHVVGESLLDAGTGAGLPGIPLAVVRPELRVVLLDSGGKKIRFINHVIRRLGIENASTVQGRLEAYQPPRQPDTITARALAPLPQIVTWCAHLFAPQTRLLAMKGRYPEPELLALPAGFRVDEITKLDVPGGSAERHLVIVRRDTT